MKASWEEERCHRCGHPRYCHLDNHGKPRSCAAKDEGEQCQGFVEPARTWTLEEIEAAYRATDISEYSLDEFRAALTGSEK